MEEAGGAAVAANATMQSIMEPPIDPTCRDVASDCLLSTADLPQLFLAAACFLLGLAATSRRGRRTKRTTRTPAAQATQLLTPTAAAHEASPMEAMSPLGSPLGSPPFSPLFAATPSVPMQLRGAKGLLEPTPAEWTRFMRARHGDEKAAIEMWRAHVAWRAQHLPAAKQLGRELPKHCYILERRCRLGGLIVFSNAAMHDPKLGSYDEYNLAVAQLFDEHLARDSSERVTIIADCRGGVGWPNPPASISHTRSLAKMLRDNFPERLNRLVVYPVPWLALAVFSALRGGLGTRTAAKARLLAGRAGNHCPMPTAGLLEFIDEEAIAECERIRNLALEDARQEGPTGARGRTPAFLARVRESERQVAASSTLDFATGSAAPEPAAASTPTAVPTPEPVASEPAVTESAPEPQSAPDRGAPSVVSGLTALGARRFDAAAAAAKGIPKGQLSTTQMLELYGLYKRGSTGQQASEAPQPSRMAVQARAKWDAWNAVASLSPDEARARYCSLVESYTGA